MLDKRRIRRTGANLGDKRMKQTYEIIFKCVVTLEARDKEEAVRLAWLRDSLDMKSTYKFLDVQVKKE